MSLGKNPAQDPFLNLGAEAVTRGVGGMTTHWTCATPRLNPYKELPMLDSDPEINRVIWDRLYADAEKIIGTSSKEFNESVRHNLVLRTLQKEFKDKNGKVLREFKPLPLACHRLSDPDYVEWHATDRILETLFTDDRYREKFTLLTNHRCTRVVMNKTQGKCTVGAAEVRCLLPIEEQREDLSPTFYVRAKAYVIACGSVGTAQVRATLLGWTTSLPLPCRFLPTPRETSASAFLRMRTPRNESLRRP